MTRHSPHHGRLYFFPMILPLAELVPWLLSLIGAVAGLSGFFHGPFWQRWRLVILSVSALCLIAAAGTYLYQKFPPAIRFDGTKDVVASAYPKAMRYPPSTIKHPAPADGFGPLWTTATKKQILSAPVIVGDLLLYGSYEGTVEAVSLKDGTPVWSLKLTDFVFNLTPSANGIVYASEGLHYSEDSYLSALRASDGTVLWQRRFYGHLEEAVAEDVTNSRLWLSTGPGGLWSLDAKNGKALWHAAIGHIDSEPLYAQDRVYVPSQPDESKQTAAFFAVNAATGKTDWQLPLQGQPWGSPLLDKTGNIILNSTGRGQIGVTRKDDAGWAQGISRTGKLVWETQLPSMPIQPSAYLPDTDTIIHTTKSGDILALKASDGTVIWKAKVGDDIQASAASFSVGNKQMLAVTSADGHFAILDALTGADIKRNPIEKYCTSSPVYADGILYVTTAHKIRAIKGLTP